MAGNRKAAETLILEMISDVDPSGKNTELLRMFFSKMSDKQFDEYMLAIEEKRDYVSVVDPNLEKSAITAENNLLVARKYGIEFFQRLWLTDPVTGMVYQTNERYPCFYLPCRRQIQTLKNKMSVPEDNKHVDDLTDQPTGVSKGSAISFPELLAMRAQGCDSGIEELIKFRGGDIKAMVAMDKSIHETGGARMSSFYYLGTRARATDIFSIFLKGMHLDNNA